MCMRNGGYVHLMSLFHRCVKIIIKISRFVGVVQNEHYCTLKLFGY